MNPRKIIHIDCDCFYAAVECLDNPALRGLPIAVGGESDRRGVIATCSYEARAYGVRSAMPTAHARRLCPQLKLVKPRFSRYKAISQQVRDILEQYTEHIEPLSLDEAYLDVSGQPHCQGSATLIAEAIRQQIKQEVGITVSAGIAPNKFLAKIASDWRKPNGCFTITPDQVQDFVRTLPVGKLHGVGKVTEQRLHNLGIHTCADLLAQPEAMMHKSLGRFGDHLYRLAQGIDERPVQSRELRKSVSVEHTFSRDLPALNNCLSALPDLLERLQDRLISSSQRPIHKAFVKLRFNDFETTTVECRAQNVQADLYTRLCESAYARGTRPVRLLGVGVRFAESSPLQQQLCLPF